MLLLGSTILSPRVHAQESRSPVTGKRVRLYIGTYTRGKSEGIYMTELNVSSGELSPPRLAAPVENPSFLAAHSSGDYVYAVGEVSGFGGQQAGAVSAFSVDAGTGGLDLINQQPSGGRGPCHLIVDGAGKNVLVANYGGGSVAVLPIGEDGRLRPASCVIQHSGSSVDTQRQKGPHAHGVYLDADQRFAFVADLGLDQILGYRFDGESSKLVAGDPPHASVPPGAGPRHFAFHPSGKFAYVINELDSTITAFGYDAPSGTLTAIESVSALPAGFEGKSFTAEIEVHSTGRFLYGSNRGHDSIAVFAVNPEDGRLKLVEHESTQGEAPRHFAIDPTGRFLLAANQNSDNIVAFRIDAASGALEPTGHEIKVGSPVCVLFMDPE